MVIQHNLIADTTLRQQGIIKNNKLKLSEKLASGYRLNRAADDAAGLSISEKMRAQVRGLGQASENIQDGISLIQTAEGGLNEIHSMLQRVRELAVQAATDTYTDEDRKNIQMEVDQLLDEIDRVSADTEFNTIKVLQGVETVETVTGKVELDGSAVGGLPDFVGRTEDGYLSSTYKNYYAIERVIAKSKGTFSTVLSEASFGEGMKPYGTTTFRVSDDANFINEYNGGSSTPSNTYAIGQYAGPYKEHLKNAGDSIEISRKREDVEHSGTEIDFSSLNAGNIRDLVDSKFPQGFYSTCCTCSSKYSINFTNKPTDGSSLTSSGSHYIYNVDISALLAQADVKGEDLVQHVLDEIARIDSGTRVTSDDGTIDYGVQLKNHYTLLTASETNKAKLVIYDGRSMHNSSTNNKVTATRIVHGFGSSATASPRNGLFGVGVYYTKEVVEIMEIKGFEDSELNIQSGANAMQRIKIPWPHISTNRLGVETVPMLVGEGASKGIDVVDGAIEFISGCRTRFGACQNRLEHACSNADNSEENLQAAESRIRDTNIGITMVDYAKNSILEQASQAMLAQAQKAAQGILTLL